MLTSADIDRRLGLAIGTVERRTGVVTRHEETARTAAALGADAARQALAAAGRDLNDIDCVVAANGTPDQAMPSNAALLMHELGCGERATAGFDVNASCLGFLTALDTLSYLIAAGRYRHVLIVSSDIASCGLDWSHLDASGIFGDGAAAAVVGAANGSTSAILSSSLHTFSDGAHLCEIKGGGSRFHPSRISEPFAPLATFQMDGKAVFRMVGTRLPGFVDDLVTAAGLRIGDLAVVVPHQASAHALRYTRRRLRIRTSQMIDIFADHGNQVSASMPSALHAAIADGRLRRGDHALLIGSGAGVSLGGMVLCY